MWRGPDVYTEWVKKGAYRRHNILTNVLGVKKKRKKDTGEGIFKLVQMSSCLTFKKWRIHLQQKFDLPLWDTCTEKHHSTQVFPSLHVTNQPVYSRRCGNYAHQHFGTQFETSPASIGQSWHLLLHLDDWNECLYICQTWMNCHFGWSWHFQMLWM